MHLTPQNPQYKRLKVEESPQRGLAARCAPVPPRAARDPRRRVRPSHTPARVRPGPGRGLRGAPSPRRQTGMARFRRPDTARAQERRLVFPPPLARGRAVPSRPWRLKRRACAETAAPKVRRDACDSRDGN